MKTWNKVFSFLLAVAVMASAVTVPGTVKAEETKNIQVTMSMQMGGEFLNYPETFTLSGNEAEAYGYTDTEGAVTALDAFVKYHEYFWGDAFTPETKDDFLEVGASGWVTKFMSDGGSNFGFYVNDVAPSDTVNIVTLQNQDNVVFYEYQDQTYWTDKYATIYDGEKLVHDLNVAVNTSKQLTLMGDSFGYVSPLEEVTVVVLDDDQMPVEAYEIETDEDGMFTVSFDEVGTYYLTTDGTDATDSPLAKPYVKVNVVSAKEMGLIDAADKAKEEAAAAKADADKAKEEAATAKEEADKAKEEAATVKAEADKAKEEAATVKAEADKAKEEAAAAKAEADKAKGEAATAKAEAEKAKGEAATAKAAAEKAKAEAEQAKEDAKAPAKVKGLKLKSNKLIWSQVDGAAGYDVYQRTGKLGWKKVKTVKSATYKVKMKKGTTYQFKVRAYKLTKDNKKVYGSFSAIKKVKRK